MTDLQRLTILRAVHTAIYAVMASATLAVLYAGVTGAHGPWLWICLGLLSVEIVVFAGCGMKCPLTAVAVKYGATPQGAYDTLLPERFTRHTLHIFGPLIAVGLALLAARWGLRAGPG
jgi:hypothetical protein